LSSPAARHASGGPPPPIRQRTCDLQEADMMGKPVLYGLAIALVTSLAGGAGGPALAGSLVLETRSIAGASATQPPPSFDFPTDAERAAGGFFKRSYRTLDCAPDSGDEYRDTCPYRRFRD
jgi:hypothetical protein